MRHNMSSLTTTHEMNDQSKTEIRQVSQFLVHPHPPDRFHIHYFFYIAFRSDPMRNTQSQFLLVLPLKSPRADKNPGFPLPTVPHMRNHPRMCGGTLDINRESDIHAVAGTLQTPISIYALREESDQASAVRRTGRPPNPLPCGCWALSMVAASVIASAPSALFRGCEWWVRDSNPRCVSVGDLQAPAVAAGPTHQKCDRIYKDRGPLRR